MAWFSLDAPRLSLLVSTLSFLLSLWYYTNMVHLTQQLQQANTMNVLYADYSSPKTLAALELIEDFIERHGIENYPFAFLSLRKEGREEGRNVDRSRRHLTQWFSRVQYFYEGGYLQFDALRKFPGAQRAKHFLDLVEPLEFVSRKTTGRKHAGVFDFLRSLYHLKKHTLSPEFVEQVNKLLEGDRAGRRSARPANSRNRKETESSAGDDDGRAGGQRGPERRHGAGEADSGEASSLAATEAEGDALPHERRFSAYPMESVGAEGEEELEDEFEEGGDADAAANTEKEEREENRGETEKQQGSERKAEDQENKGRNKEEKNAQASFEVQKAGTDEREGRKEDRRDDRGEEL
ncbi:hypothetical protein TGVEG_269450 [Toxoplasma gondii VEG]|uniref:Uncharacterized protein n=3 Tax=Toxoplasma gondii TaxID=5811 RepID=B9Q5K3_TOXGV|nr:hypothetical protein TGVEG_269450 [Toxoplasma gondii VEG]KFG52377.1 hypothetical protein TGP89_269450 [Toxoplasma gondii p89]PUA87777.1 hypothetical protein TGBR9_269450 [Toxoplasma gondii TgCATBr9]CEL75397.1 TPA: hypothetical protein BN1205_016680 [Toxoplasma gondii VEG]